MRQDKWTANRRAAPTPSPSPAKAGERSRRRAQRLSFGAVIALLVFAALLAGCGVPGTIHTQSTLPPARPTATPAPLPPVAMPQDEAPHHDLTEWWYYTGHLHGADAHGQTHTYGFELVIFQTLRGDLPPYYAAHFAISDITAGAFHYDERAGFASAPVPASGAGAAQGFDLALGGWAMRGLDGHDQLSAALADYSIQLNLTDELPHAILHNGNGIISYGAGGFSYYYSRPLMSVSGALLDHGASVQVTGQAWMDHQWGNFVSLAGAGWDWYSIQLANHTEYMLYVIRDARKQPVATFGTAIAADGSASEIAPQQIETQATGSWTSPVTGGVYPSGWRVTLPGQQVSLTLTPLLRDQELVTARSTGVAYWEGAVGVSGTAAGKPVTGEGYVELTGYASVPSSSPSAATP